jgi:hypothetical protein
LRAGTRCREDGPARSCTDPSELHLFLQSRP